MATTSLETIEYSIKRVSNLLITRLYRLDVSRLRLATAFNYMDGYLEAGPNLRSIRLREASPSPMYITPENDLIIALGASSVRKLVSLELGSATEASSMICNIDHAFAEINKRVLMFEGEHFRSDQLWAHSSPQDDPRQTTVRSTFTGFTLSRSTFTGFTLRSS
jgi:hypothetical protein